MEDKLMGTKPVGSIGLVRILLDDDAHYAYNADSEVVGRVVRDEKYFVYKNIDNWYLIENHKWIKCDICEFSNEDIVVENELKDKEDEKHIEEEVNDSNIDIEAEIVVTKDSESNVEEVMEEVQEIQNTEVDIESNETKQVEEVQEEKQEKTSLFKKIKRIFGSK